MRAARDVTDIKPMSAERLADIKDCLRRHGKEHTFWKIVSPEAFQIVDLAATPLLDATLVNASGQPKRCGR